MNLFSENLFSIICIALLFLTRSQKCPQDPNCENGAWGSCTLCTSYRYLQDGFCYGSPPSCPSGQYQNFLPDVFGSCSSCSPYCSTCMNPDEGTNQIYCLSCPQGQSLNCGYCGSNFLLLSTASPSFYSRQTCFLDGNCETLVEIGNCSQCKPNNYLQDGFCNVNNGVYIPIVYDSSGFYPEWGSCTSGYYGSPIQVCNTCSPFCPKCIFLRHSSRIYCLSCNPGETLICGVCYSSSSDPAISNPNYLPQLDYTCMNLVEYGQCTQCNSGYVLQNGVCFAGSTAPCTNSSYYDYYSQCLSCSPYCSTCTYLYYGLQSSGNSMVYCLSCPQGQTLIAGYCYSPPGTCFYDNNCQNVAEYGKCFLCQNGYYSIHGVCYNTYSPDINNCGNNSLYMGTSSQCLPCPLPCSTCVTLNNGNPAYCTSCLPGSNLYCGMCVNCSLGNYWQNQSQSCQPCISHCDFCPNSTGCYNCSQGYYWQNQSQTCQPCVSNCVSCGGSTSCYNCSQGYYYQNQSQTCQPCMSSCAVCVNSTGCNTCDQGYYFQNQSQTCQPCISNCATCVNSTGCNTCDQGYYYQNQSQTCQPCVSNCVSCGGSTSCYNCSQGYYYQNQSQTCQSCGSNCLQCQSSNSCAACNTSYSLFSGQCFLCFTNCQVCTADNICSLCKSSFFLQNNSNTSCSQCSDNCDTCVDYKGCTQCASLHKLSGNQCSVPIGDVIGAIILGPILAFGASYLFYKFLRFFVWRGPIGQIGPEGSAGQPRYQSVAKRGGTTADRSNALRLSAIACVVMAVALSIAFVDLFEKI